MHSEQIGEPMLGTVFEEARLLLVEQPGPWGRSGLETSGFDPAIAAQLRERARAADARLLAVRRPGRELRRSDRTWISVDCDRRSMRWGTYQDDAALLDLAFDEEGQNLEGPVFLVCTNGSRDPCCAIRGRPVAATLAAMHVDVWECSHIGGHRFGANVIVLPVGDVYGRIVPADVAAMVDSNNGGQLRTAVLRGRLGLPPTAQTALVAAMERIPAHRRADARVLTSEAGPEGTVTVRVLAADVTYIVTVARRDAITTLPSCGAAAPKTVRFYEPLRISTASPATVVSGSC